MVTTAMFVIGRRLGQRQGVLLWLTHVVIHLLTPTDCHGAADEPMTSLPYRESSLASQIFGTSLGLPSRRKPPVSPAGLHTIKIGKRTLFQSVFGLPSPWI